MARARFFEALESRRMLSTFTVTNTADSGAGSLRQAILDSNASGGADVVEFAAVLSGEIITLTSGQLSITDALTINGPGAGQLTVSGNNASRIFSIGTAAVSISGLTISEGRSDYGGAIVLHGGSLALSSVNVTKNTSTGAGGGIAANGPLTIVDSRITFNTGQQTGGITAGSALTITGSTISENSSNSVGAAITFGDTLTLIDSTVALNHGNSANAVGIACFGSAIIQNSTIAQNTVTVGIATNGRTVTLISTIVAGNTGGEISGSVAPGSTNNLVRRTSSAGGLVDGSNGNIVGVDPLLGPLTLNGGLTPTMALLDGSPAIDKGLNPLNLTTDQRGSGFARNEGAGPDIGAYEVAPEPSGPLITSVVASHGFGRFIQSIDLQNTFTALVSDPQGNGIDRVEFALGGILVVDSNGADGWNAQFDMGLLSGNSVLSITAVDGLGTHGSSHDTTIVAAPRPVWLDSELLVVAFDADGTQGYTVTVGQGVGSVAAIPDFFPDAKLGTENFGTFFSGDLGVAAGFYFTVHIPFAGTPSVESLTVTWSATTFNRKVSESEWTVPFENGSTKWSIFAPALDNLHELDIVNPGAGIGGTAIVYPGFFASGTVSFTLSEDLSVEFDLAGSFQFVRSLWNSPPETVYDDVAYAPSEPLIAGIEIPFLSVTLRTEITFDLNVAIEGSFALQYSNGAFTGEIKSLDASYIFEPALLLTLGGDDTWYEVPNGRVGLKCGGGCGFTLGLHDGDLKVGFQWDLVISIYVRPRGKSYGVSAPVLNFGSFHTEDLLATDVSALFTIPVYPPPEEYVPPPSIAEADIATYGDLAVEAYLTEPTRNSPSSLYARFRQGDAYGPPELIVGSNYERSGLTLSMTGGTPFAMWSQSTIDRQAAENLSVEQDMAAREIYWSARINGAWTTPARLTDNGVMDWTPSLAFNSSGTAGIAAWVQSLNPGTFPAEDDSEIYVARWDGSAWGAPLRFTSNLSRDVSPVVVALADGRFMVSSIRTSGGIDSVVYSIIAADSNAVEAFGLNFQSPTGTSINSLASITLSDGRVALAWLESTASTGPRVRALFFDPSDGSQSAIETVADSRVSSRSLSLAEDSGQLAIVFSANLPAGSVHSGEHVLVSYRTISEPSGTWTRPIPITRGDRDHVSPGAAYLGDHSLLVSYIASDLFGVGSSIVPSPLGSDLNDPDGAQVARITHRPDLTVTATQVDQPGASAGTTVTLAVTIANAGPAPSGTFLVRVLAEGTGEVYSVSLELQPGQSQVLMPTILLDRKDWKLTVQLDPSQSIVELNEQNNSRSISSVLFADTTAKPGSIPVGAADASDSHRIVAVNPYGQPIVFEQSGSVWTVTELTSAVGGSPAATDSAVIWVDPKDNLTYAAVPSASGLLLFTRSGAGTWTYRNLSSETGASSSPTHGLTQFTSLGAIVVVAGVTADDRIVAFQQTLATVAGGGPEFKFVDISGELASQSMTTPVLGGLISYVTSWDQWTLAGIDASGQIQAVWVNISQFTTWRTDDLSTITGAPSVQGQLAVTLTTWGGINLTGLDSAGRVLTTWWVPSFGGNWVVSDLTAVAANGGTPLAAGRISGFTTPWGGLSYVGLASDGTVIAYWWEPINNTWRVDPLLPDSVPSDHRPTGALTSYSSASGTLNVFGISDSGNVLRMWWNPGGSATWTAEDLTALAVQN